MKTLQKAFSAAQSQTNTTTAVSAFFAVPEAAILGATCNGYKSAGISAVNNLMLSGLSLGEKYLNEKFDLSGKVGEYYKWVAPAVTAVTSVGIKYGISNFTCDENKTTFGILSILDLVKVGFSTAIDNGYISLDNIGETAEEASQMTNDDNVSDHYTEL